MNEVSRPENALDISIETLPLTSGLERHILPRSNDDRAIEAHMLTMAGLETDETWRFAESVSSVED